MIRVLLCDDHRVVREGLERVLEGAEDIEVVASAADGIEGVEAAVRHRPDVVVMDLVMPRLDGVEATRRIVGALPDSKVIVLTSFSDDARVIEALDAGAVGYLLKDAPTDQLLQGIRAAARGDVPLDPRAARAMLSVGPRGATIELTDREREVLALLAAGLPNKLIARRLGVTTATVKAHLTRIYRHIDVHNRAEAARWASAHGYDGAPAGDRAPGRSPNGR